MRRLYLQIYRAFLGVVFVSVVVAMGTSALIWGRDRMKPPFIDAASHLLLDDLPEGEAMAPALKARAEKLNLQVTLRDQKGGVLAESPDRIYTPLVDDLAHRIAVFHRQADRVVPSKELGTAAAVYQPMVENFNQVRQATGVAIETVEGDLIPVSHKTIFPYAEPASHTFRMRLDFNGGGLQLFPGMFVKAVFEIGEKEALVVPTMAIIRRSEVTAVYVRTAEGVVSFRSIRRGSTK